MANALFVSALAAVIIDTIVVCFMTASVILITKDANRLYQVGGGIKGAELTSAAFGSAISWFPYILSIVVRHFRNLRKVIYQTGHQI